MKNLSKILAISLWLIPVSVTAEEGGVDANKVAAPIVAAEASWVTDYKATLEVSKKDGKPILVDFSGSDWCGWCIKLDKEVFSQQPFLDYAKDNLHLLMLDFPRSKPMADELKAQNKEVAQKYNIEGYPTVLLLDGEGKELARTGYKSGGAEAYVTHLKSLLEKK